MNFDLSAAVASIQGMGVAFLERLPYLLIAVCVYGLFHIAARTTRRVIRHFSEQRRKHRNVGLVLGRLAEGGLMLLGVLVALVIALPSFQPAQLIQLLGISGVAIGFAFRDILQNFLAGILILLTEPFRIGDQIIVGGFEGTVEEIETRATSIKTYDGRRVVIPNSNLFTESVTVNTAFEQRRLQYDIGIGYGDDIAAAPARDPACAARRARHPAGARAGSAGRRTSTTAPSTSARAGGSIPPRRTDVMVSMDQALHAIKDALTEEGIDLPFPTQQILFHDQTEATDGDRARQREGWPAGRGEVPGPRAAETRARLAPTRRPPRAQH